MQLWQKCGNKKATTTKGKRFDHGQCLEDLIAYSMQMRSGNIKSA